MDKYDVLWQRRSNGTRVTKASVGQSAASHLLNKPSILEFCQYSLFLLMLSMPVSKIKPLIHSGLPKIISYTSINKGQLTYHTS